MGSEVSYCLLAEIRSRKSNISSLIEVFEEMVETLFSHYYKKGAISENINDLRNKFNDTYGLDIPFPTLKLILSRLKQKYGEKFSLFSDYAFSIEDETIKSGIVDIRKSEKEIEELNNLYEKHCGKTMGECRDLYSFLEQSKENYYLILMILKVFHRMVGIKMLLILLILYWDYQNIDRYLKSF